MNVERRDFLILAPAAALAATPALAMRDSVGDARLLDPAGEDPHPRLWNAWKSAERDTLARIDAADAFMHTPRRDSSAHEVANEAQEAAEAREWAIFRELCETPAYTAAGLAVQAAAVVWMTDIGSHWADEVDTSAAGNLVAGLKRLAGVS